LNGATIKMNSDGSPGKGTGVSVLAPLIPWAADQDKAGEKPKLALANTQLQLARKARQIGASRCPICEACRAGMCEIGASR
jgi:type VI secretion system secreted protein VgrG